MSTEIEAPGFAPWIARYLEWMGIRGYTPATMGRVDKHLGLFARWCAERGIGDPSEVSRAVVDRYQRWLYHYRKANGKPLGRSTQHSRLSGLKVFFGWMARHRHLEVNPASELELPRFVQGLPTEALSIGEVERVLAVPDVETALGVRDRAILETLYASGIRRSELVGLDLGDLDAERAWLVVRKGKGGKDRVVPLGERALAWVSRYLEDVRPQLVTSRSPSVLFLNGLGETFSLDGLTQLVRRYVETSGVGKRGACHLLRHTMATLMLEGGADVRYVQEMLGHAKLETTQIYTHVAIGRLAAVHAATHPGARLQSREGRSAGEEMLSVVRCALSESGSEARAGDGDGGGEE